jgi:hypothetical protein
LRIDCPPLAAWHDDCFLASTPSQSWTAGFGLAAVALAWRHLRMLFFGMPMLNSATGIDLHEGEPVHT